MEFGRTEKLVCICCRWRRRFATVYYRFLIRGRTHVALLGVVLNTGCGCIGRMCITVVNLSNAAGMRNPIKFLYLTNTYQIGCVYL